MQGLGKLSCSDGLLASLKDQKFISERIVGIEFTKEENKTKSVVSFGKTTRKIESWVSSSRSEYWNVPLESIKFGKEIKNTTGIAVIMSSMEMAFAPIADFVAIANLMTEAGYKCQWYSGYLYGCDVGKSPMYTFPDIIFSIKDSPFKIRISVEDYAWRVYYYIVQKFAGV